MVDTLEDDAPGLSSVQKWAAESRGRKSFEDDPRSERPAAATPEIIDRVHQILMGDRQLTISHTAKEVGMSVNEQRTFFTRNLTRPKFLLDGCLGS